MRSITTLSVREISPEDYPGVNSIARSLNPTWFTESALEEIANALRHDHGFVAMQNEKQIGFVMYRLNDDNETADLTWMGVRPDFQRKGVGRRLVEAVEQALGKKGIHRIEVFTVAATVDYEPYALTRRFYHAMGFSDVSIEPKGFPSGDDKLLLRKQSGAQRITDTSNNA